MYSRKREECFAERKSFWVGVEIVPERAKRVWVQGSSQVERVVVEKEKMIWVESSYMDEKYEMWNCGRWFLYVARRPAFSQLPGAVRKYCL